MGRSVAGLCTADRELPGLQVGVLLGARADLSLVTDRIMCPPAVLAAVPEDMREDFLSGNGHLEAAVRRRIATASSGGLPAERDEVRAGWIALGHMMSRGLPLGPLADVPARFVSRPRVHHRDCYLLRRAEVQTAPLVEIAHRPYCSVCEGPGFDLSDDHLAYLWALMAVDDITDPWHGLLGRSRRPPIPSTIEQWRQVLRDEIAECERLIATLTGLTAAEPRIGTLAQDVTIRTRYQIRDIEARLAVGPTHGELEAAPVPGGASGSEHQQLADGLPVPAAADVMARPAAAGESPRQRVIDTRRTRNRVRSPVYVTGMTHQRIELVQVLTGTGRVRSDPALAHPVWGESYEWMARKLAEKHPPSAGRAPIWGIVTSSIAHNVCDSSCGGGLPACELFHPYPGHASVLVQVPEKRVLLSDWAGWDKLVFGGYVPVDEADAVAFGRALTERFGSDIPAPCDWPDDLLEKARASWVRCLRVRYDNFSRPLGGTQFVVSELRATDVIDIVAGPPLASAGPWWDHYVSRHPDEADRRERASASIEDLRSGPVNGSSHALSL